MTIRARRQLIQPKDTVQLTAIFKDQNGNPADTDSFPQITITSPDGIVATGPTSAGIQHISTGKYEFDFTVGFTGPLGVWSDDWVGFINGFRIEASFDFVVAIGDQPQLNFDGYFALGDDVGFDFTQVEIFNINKLLKTVRARLNSRGPSKSTDKFGNIIYVNCDIYSTDMLTTFLANSITLFNEIPHSTFFSFADTQFINQYHDVLVEGAVVMALASQALIERGREYTVTDNGINFTPPTMSELLNTQYSALLTSNYEKVKFIKNGFKPFPIGLGTFSATRGGLNPSFRNLRLLRARQIF